MNCNCCFDATLSQCQDGIIINGNFTPLTEFRVIVTGKQGVYEANFTSDADGHIEVEPADYPAGLFNPYAGPIKIEVYLGQDKQTFNLTETYDCIDLSIVPGTFINNEIGK